MNRDEFERNWHQLKVKVQKKWDKFTHDDIANINGKYEQLLRHLQKKYGYTKEQADWEMKNWQETHQRAGREKKERPLIGGEEKVSDLLAHEALTYQDTHSTYPFQPIEGEKEKAQGLQNFRKSSDKNKNDNQSHKKRKAG